MHHLHPDVAWQLALELPELIDLWQPSIATFRDDPASVDDAPLVTTANLAQRTRLFMRLLGEERAEDTAVVIETVCTLLLSGLLGGSASLYRQMSIGLHAICRTARWHGEQQAASTGYNRVLTDSALIKATQGLLLHISHANNTCKTFAVYPAEHDTCVLRLRGFDLRRIRSEGLSLYLVEFLWTQLVRRGGGLIGLAGYLGRNGHLFDVAYTPTPYHRTVASPPEGILRALYATPLKRDFVEALTRVPEERLFPVDLAAVHAARPSWGAEAPPASLPTLPRSAPPLSDLDNLIHDYDRALTAAFNAARAEQPFEPLFIEKE